MSSSIFITGGTGFVCTQIIHLLLEKQYRVTTSVRSPSKAEGLIALHPEWKDKIAFVYVQDVAAPGAFDKLLETGRFDYIIHTASPVNFSVKDVKKDLIDPAVHGTTELLKAAHAHAGPQLERFVLLASSVEIFDSHQDISVAARPRNEGDWNPVTEAEAVEANNSVLGYIVGKKMGEKAAWDFVASVKPSFDLVTINPDIIIGPMLQGVSGPKSVNETNQFSIYSFLDGTYKEIDGIRFPFYHFVDVRDVAKAHVLALTEPKAKGQRILLASGLITPQLVVNIIREHFPDLRNRLIEGMPGQILPSGVAPTDWDTRRSFEIFGAEWKYRPLEESVVDTVRNLLALEEKWNKL